MLISLVSYFPPKIRTVSRKEAGSKTRSRHNPKQKLSFEFSFENQPSLRKKFLSFKNYFKCICNETAFTTKKYSIKIMQQLLQLLHNIYEVTYKMRQDIFSHS